MENPKSMTPEQKALMVSIGSARVHEALLADGFRTKATAGPGAGGSSVFLRSGDRRVRLAINPDSPLRIVPGPTGVQVELGDVVIADGVLEQPLCHCPGQAYITISERCIHDCLFCPVPKLAGGIKDIPTITRMVERASATGSLQAISLTSGVAESAEHEAERVAMVVKALRARFDLPIGVSVYPTASSTELLYAAGADEVKYNVETLDRDLFSRVCPGLDLGQVLDSLEEAVDTFGKNAVSSNFIIGLGEDDECVLDGVSQLAGMGVVPILRPVSASPLRTGECDIERPSATRLLRLAMLEKSILTSDGLDPRRAKTMCLPCTGCDLTPFRDI